MKYLISLDGSQQSHKAFELAESLYKPGDHIHIVTISKPKESIEKGEELLEKYEELCQERGMKNERIVLKSQDVGVGLEQAIRDYNIDILILGTRGMNTLKKVFINSVSDYAMNNIAACDVIVAK
ncbi:hypothetical protein DICPUDRAFT_47156 [Dictyostelium purpureum]|uniref:UspA domain-containing protein n=1 Tax=Dictyostelium purpureum TaxID=5786 RepID=F0ZHZ7_DICPU|nr:uncharacterized protein DICPUDRAFT_47156 [Dictyostelium purpureum]EGC36407.1 hypothetical protein DICPUDRAFT_47156 [Dictyostelium purpureum]|eukprot:XP_003287040.1 hypothetical protein DICPUDRAFT_47156 [Dictyostelium purpureum]